MSRRRQSSDQEDSLDLLLDTVSNVFGGVMFLTLLAALLILSRGSSPKPEPEETVKHQPDPKVNAELVQTQQQQFASELAALEKSIQRLDPNGTTSQKVERLANLEATVKLAQKQHKRVEATVTDRQSQLDDQDAAQSDLEQQIETLTSKIADASEEMKQVRQESARTVQFRPLTSSRSMETVIILRYGRWYLLFNGPHGGLNRRDFFVLPGEDGVKSVTPKPHRGNVVNAETLPLLIQKIRPLFPPRRFHVTIAVWDDSFAEFNPLKDALSAAGYKYRTLPCDSTSRLTNQAAVDPFVQ